MKRTLLTLACSAATFFAATAVAGAATWPWGPTSIGDGQYTYIQGTQMTENAPYGGTPRIRFNVENWHSVNIRSAPCGGDYHNYAEITIPAHDSTYHYVAQTYGYGACINFYARSLFGTQTLSGYILS
jgi:hypothetical protein